MGAITHHARLFRAYVALHAKTAMEYRSNFFTQSLFMIFNDAMFILVFYFLFSHFGTINGYDAHYAILVFGMSGMAYGFIALFFGNRRNLSNIISEGELDVYLTSPVDELFHALISRSSFDGAGDILFGVIVIAIFAPSMLLVGIIGGMAGSLVLLGFAIIIDCGGFYLERPKNAMRAAHNTAVALSSWPIDAYSGWLRSALYLVPFAFVGAVPVHLVQSFSWSEAGLLFLIAVFILIIAVSFWRIGVRRYESGSRMTTRS